VLLFLVLLFADAPIQLSRHYLELRDPDFEIGVARNLGVRSDRLILMDNRRNRLASLRVTDVLSEGKVIAEKGEGPGEIYLPYFMTTAPAGEIIVYDNRGLSFFDADQGFSHRFRVFTPGLSMAASETLIFFLTIRDDQNELIDVYSYEGERMTSFFEKFLQVR